MPRVCRPCRLPRRSSYGQRNTERDVIFSSSLDSDVIVVAVSKRARNATAVRNEKKAPYRYYTAPCNKYEHHILSRVRGDALLLHVPWQSAEAATAAHVMRCTVSYAILCMRVLYTYRTVVGGARREIGFGRLGAFVTSELRRSAQQYDNIVTVMLLWYVDLWAQLGGGAWGYTLSFKISTRKSFSWLRFGKYINFLNRK